MDFWRRACGVSRLDHVRNEEIRRRVQRDEDIMDTINMKRLIWYGHVQRMSEERWPKKMLDWIPNRRRKRGRPRTAWRENIQLEMEWRNCNTGTGRTGKNGEQDAGNGDSCKKAAYIYTSISARHVSMPFYMVSSKRRCQMCFLN